MLPLLLILNNIQLCELRNICKIKKISHNGSIVYEKN
jgi:hypothetical protein